MAGVQRPWRTVAMFVVYRHKLTGSMVNRGSRMNQNGGVATHLIPQDACWRDSELGPLDKGSLSNQRK